jgi:hypothetical protein
MYHFQTFRSADADVDVRYNMWKKKVRMISVWKPENCTHFPVTINLVKASTDITARLRTWVKQRQGRARAELGDTPGQDVRGPSGPGSNFSKPVWKLLRYHRSLSLVLSVRSDLKKKSALLTLLWLSCCTITFLHYFLTRLLLAKNNSSGINCPAQTGSALAEGQ